MPGKLWVSVSVVRSIHRLYREGTDKHKKLDKLCCTWPEFPRSRLAPDLPWALHSVSFILYLKFIVFVLGAFVERPIIPKLPYIVDTIEALDTIRYSIHL